MVHQEGGWPLGLQPLNTRVGLVRTRDFSGSISFSTLVTGSSSSSSFSSSDFDTESTASFFRDRSITLGHLIGITNILNFSRRTLSSRKPEALQGKKNSNKSKIWFSLCAKACANSESPDNTPSLRHFLEVERRAANAYGTDRNSIGYEVDEFHERRPVSEHNSLFENGQIAPPRIGADGSAVLSRDDQEQDQWIGSKNGRRPNTDFPVLLSCLCGQPTN